MEHFKKDCPESQNSGKISGPPFRRPEISILFLLNFVSTNSLRYHDFKAACFPTAVTTESFSVGSTCSSNRALGAGTLGRGELTAQP